MANVRRRAPVKRKSYHTRSEVKKTARAALARDDLRQAFAGKENTGVRKTGSRHSTNVKSRQTKYSRFRVPKR